MNNDIPASRTPNDYWYRLHNLLQNRGWKNRFHSLKPRRDGPDNAPTWHIFCTFDGRDFGWDMDYGWGDGAKLMDAKNRAARMIFRRFLCRAAIGLIQRQLEEISQPPTA